MITCMTVMPCASRREVQLLDMHRVKYSEGGRGGGYQPLRQYLMHSERKTKTRKWFTSSLLL